jgi:hypothetical protein
MSTLAMTGEDLAEFSASFEFDVNGPNGASFRQLEILFERLDRAALISEVVLAAGGRPLGVDAPILVLRARRAVQRDPGAPRVIDLATGSITVSSITKGARRTGVVLLAAGALFHSTDFAVTEANRLVRDSAALVQTIEHVGRLDPKARKAKNVLAGQGADPEIRLTAVRWEPRG